MPITPVPEYDGARYPTLDEVAAERRAFLRRVGLSAIAAALGPSALACKAEGSGGDPVPLTQARQTSPTPAPTPPLPAGVPVPPKWPGPRGALVGGRSIEVTYADGSHGRVALAAVFSSDNAALEGALIDAEAGGMMQRAAGELVQQGMKPEEVKLSPEMFEQQARERVALGLVVGELVRRENLTAKPAQVRALVAEAAQTYEQPEAVVRWHYEKPERLRDFEAMVLEQNVVDWIIARARVTDEPTTFEQVMGQRSAA